MISSKLSPKQAKQSKQCAVWEKVCTRFSLRLRYIRDLVTKQPNTELTRKQRTRVETIIVLILFSVLSSRYKKFLSQAEDLLDPSASSLLNTQVFPNLVRVQRSPFSTSWTEPPWRWPVHFVPVYKPLVLHLAMLCAVCHQQLQPGTEKEASQGCRIPAPCLLSQVTVPLTNYLKRKKGKEERKGEELEEEGEDPHSTQQQSRILLWPGQLKSMF